MILNGNFRRIIRHKAVLGLILNVVLPGGLFSVAIAAETAPVQPAAPAVSVIKLQPVELVDLQLVTGSVVPREEVLISPEIEGLRVTEILADVGDQVKAGQVLIKLSRDSLNAQMDQWAATLKMSDAQIAQARSQIVQAEAALAQSTPALSRATDLLAKNAGTQAVVEQRAAEQRTNQARLANAKDGLSVAIADQANKQAQWNELKVRLARTEIKSPVDGIISRRTARLGSIASALNDALFRVVAKGEMELEAEVPEVNLAKMAVGQVASVEIGADVVLTGKVRLVSTEIDKATRLGTVRIALPSDPHVRIGSFAKGSVEVARKTAIAVPLAALQYDGADAFAQVVTSGHVTVRKVTPGLSANGLVEIRNGLNAGDAIVARAGAFLHDGDAVTQNEVPAASKGAL